MYMQDSLPELTPSLAQLLESHLLASANILECRVLLTTDSQGEAWLRAAVVSGTQLTVDQIKSQLQQDLNENSSLSSEQSTALLHRLHILPLTALPLTQRGEIDDVALLQLPIFETSLYQAWEQQLSPLAAPASLAVTTQARQFQQGRLHLQDVLAESTVEHRSLVISNLSEAAPAAEYDSNAPLSQRSGEDYPLPEQMPLTLPQVLQFTAAQDYAQGLRYVQLDGSERWQSYADLQNIAATILHNLRQQGCKAGDKIILQLDHNADFIPVFWGCLAGGFIPVPTNVPPLYEADSASVQLLGHIWQRLAQPLIITRDGLSTELSQLAQFNGAAKVVTVEQLSQGEQDHNWHQGDPDELAILLFTSGSTGQPKGVMLTHRTLINNVASSARFNRFDHQEISLNWLHLDHVGSLVRCCIRDVYVGSQQIHAPTESFLHNPLVWLDWIDRYRVTYAWAPNFALGLINERAADIAQGKWDLSCVKSLLSVAEPIVPRTAQKFADTLSQHGFKPTVMQAAWGMSETGAAVVFSHDYLQRLPSPDHPFVEVGKPTPNFSLRLIDPQGNVVPEGVVGLLQIKGPMITVGYYENPEITAETFTADGWFDTGDLGVIQDGRLTITGRQKEMIIINGLNHYSHEIEAIVEAVPDVEPTFTVACAIRRNDSNTDDLLIFFNSSLTEAAAQADLIRRIQGQLVRKLGVMPAYVLPVQKSDIPKSSIGKLLRPKLKQRFEAGEFAEAVKQVDLCLANEQTMPAWFYRSQWLAYQPPMHANNNAPNGYCVILTDALGLADQLYDQLLPYQACVRVEAGVQFSQLTPQHYIINPEQADDYQRLFSALTAEGMPITRIVHGWQYADSSGEIEDAEQLQQAQVLGCDSVLNLVQAWLAHVPKQTPLQFLLYTSYSQSVQAGERLACERTPTQALLKTLVQEQAQIDARHVDLPLTEHGDNVGYLLRELQTPARDVCVAWRQGVRYVSRLQAVNLGADTRQAMPIKSGGLYLISGGLGDIGLALAELLLTRYQAHLLLVGRSSLPPRAEWASLIASGSRLGQRLHSLQNLEQLAGSVHYIAADITNLERVQHLVSEAEAVHKTALAGVIHLARVTHQSVIAEQDLSEFNRTLQPKVLGTWVLHQVLKTRPNALFIHFSSVSSVFGTYDMGAYAAANSFLDSFSQYQRQQGIQSFCFGWSIWEEVGQDRSYQLREVSRARGYHTLSTEQGLQSLLIGLSHDCPYLVVGLDGENPWLRQFVQHNAALTWQLTAAVAGQGSLSNLRQHASTARILDRFSHATECKIQTVEQLPLLTDGTVDRAQLSQLLSQSGQAQKVYPRDELEQQLAQIWEAVLDTQGLGIHDNFFELGGHSLLATQIMFRVHASLELHLPQRLLFEHPTIAGLAEYIRQFTHQEGSQAIPRRADVTQAAPLSFAQQRLWFLEQLEGQTAAYNIHVLLDIHGSLDRDCLQASADELIQRHSVLRTSFKKDAEDTAWQVIQPLQHYPIQYSDLRTADDAETQLERLKVQAAEHLFDLANAPLLLLHLVQLTDRHSVLLLTMHHIISDGWSIRLFCNELFQVYEALRQGKPSPLENLTLDYADYSAWQHEHLQGEVLAQKLDYWQQQLANAPAMSTLPTDRPRPAQQTYHGTEAELTISPELTESLHKLSRQSGVTLFMTLFSAFQVLLYRYSGQSDLVIGTPSAGRSHPQLERLLGFFIDTVALRTQLDAVQTECSAAELSFTALLKHVQHLTVGAYRNEDLPFEKIVEVLHPQRNLSYTPIFQIWFNMLNLEEAEFDLADLQIHYVPTANTLSKFDITLYLKECKAGLELRLVYNPDLYERARIVEFLQQYQSILSQVVAKPQQALRAFSLRTATALPDPRNALPVQTWPTVVEQLAKRAAEQPEHTAIISPAQTWTYQDLWQHSLQVSHALQQAGVHTGSIVALYGDRSPQFVASVLGILHSGAAFTILNPSYPAARLQGFAQTARAEYLIQLEAELPPELSELALPVFDNTVFDIPAPAQLEARASLDNTAYIAFTTGSTGEAKAIVGTHRPLAHFFAWYAAQFQFNERDRFSMLSGLAHDPLLRDMFTPIYSGACLCIPDPQAMIDLQPLAAWLADSGVTAMHLTPAMAEVLTMTAERPLTQIRHVVFGGDVLTRSVLSKFQALAQNAHCFNGYGATETPQLMGMQSLQTLPYEYAPLGSGIDGVQLLVLNRFGDLAGVGERGEIYIRSPYLSQGYLDAEQTAARFIANPFADAEADGSDRLYRTGDAGYYLPDGNVAFAGRTDTQVKIRGFRIELGEIETRLRQHDSVQDAVVVAYQADEHAEKVLLAYLLAAKGVQPQTADLTRLLRAAVPDYMIPADFICLERFPLNPNGKVNRATLPRPSQVKAAEPTSGFVAPRSELEQQLATAWSKLLNKERIGVHDNFFDLGGHSMLALRLISHMEKQTGQKVSLSLLFQAPTIAELAAALSGESRSEQKAIQTIQGQGTQPPLFFLSAPQYARALSNVMGKDQPFYGLNIFAFQTVPEADLNMQLVAKRFVEEMKAIQPQGPYYVGAYCGDARVAMAVVHRLTELNEEIAFFGVIDFFRWRTPRMKRHRQMVQKFGLFNYGLHKLRTRFNFSLIMKQLLIKLSKQKKQFAKLSGGGSATQGNSADKHESNSKLAEDLKIISFINRFEMARRAYPIRPYAGHIDFFLSAEILPEHAPEFANLGQAGSQVHEISGFHLSLFDEPHLTELATCMQQKMQPSRTS